MYIYIIQRITLWKKPVPDPPFLC